MKARTFREDGGRTLRVVIDDRLSDPTDVIIEFPGGRAFVARNQVGLGYWAHIEVHRGETEQNWDENAPEGKVTQHRCDYGGLYRSPFGLADFEHPAFYHFAMKIELR